MMFIDPHTHMISRTTDDYEAMAAAGIVALIEPAFWLGQPRTYVGSYVDYLSHIVGFERFRAGQFGIRHYCTIGLNSKEANNEELAEGVMEILPRFALKEGVVAIGEIGYDEQTRLEDKYFRAAARARQGTRPAGDDPHPAPRQEARHHALHGRLRGARARPLAGDRRPQQRGDGGRGAAARLLGGLLDLSEHQDGQRPHGGDPASKYGAERIIVDSACDWGISDPLGVPKTAKLALERGVPERDVRLACYDNALAAYGQSGQMQEADWLDPPAIDQRTLYEGNSVLRGGREPRARGAEEPPRPRRADHRMRPRRAGRPGGRHAPFVRFGGGVPAARTSLVAIPFLLFGDQFEAALHQEQLVAWFAVLSQLRLAGGDRPARLRPRAAHPQHDGDGGARRASTGR